MKKILTVGVYDLLHYGHVELFRRAKKLGDYLMALLIKKVSLEKCTGISFVDSTFLRVCGNRREYISIRCSMALSKEGILHGMVLIVTS